MIKKPTLKKRYPVVRNLLEQRPTIIVDINMTPTCLIGNSFFVKGCAVENCAFWVAIRLSRHFYTSVAKGFHKACNNQ